MTMKNNRDKFTEYISQIFSLCVEAKIHFEVITDAIAKSAFIKNIESGDYSYINNKTYYEIFIEIFDKEYYINNNYMNYNDAYWCGYAYSKLFYKYRKSFSYIFLKISLEKMMNMYKTYHEMDISQLFEKFEIEMEKDSILRLLLKKHSMSGAELSRRTRLSIGTINNLKKDDRNLYNATFNTVYSIALVLDEPGSMFLERINEYNE